jgi:hypothetical protein
LNKEALIERLKELARRAEAGDDDAREASVLLRAQLYTALHQRGVPLTDVDPEVLWKLQSQWLTRAHETRARRKQRQRIRGLR